MRPDAMGDLSAPERYVAVEVRRRRERRRAVDYRAFGK